MNRLIVLSFVVLVAACVFNEAEDSTPSYTPVESWYELPSGWELGHASGVGVDSLGQVYLFHRDEHPIIALDEDGKVARSWGDDLIKDAHGLEIDSDDNVWVTDRKTHTVMKFKPTGELLLELGTRDSPGEDSTHFDRPADVDFGPDGSVYVADGYGNRRVVKFSKSGEYVKAWGKSGSQPGEFQREVHTIAADRQGRVYVGEKHTPDREGRVQIFDADGNFITQWIHVGAPWGLDIGVDGYIYLCDGFRNRVLKIDREGKIQSSFGTPGTRPGQFKNTHLLAVGPELEIYVAETQNRRVQKFVLTSSVE